MPDNPLVIIFVVSIILIAIYMAVEGLTLVYNGAVWLANKRAKPTPPMPAPPAQDGGMVPASTPDDAPIVPSPAGIPNGDASMPAQEWLAMVNDHPDKYPVVFIYGPQGTGKTTILRAILHHRGGKVVLFAVKPDDAWEFGHHTIDDDGTFTGVQAAMQATLQHTKQRIADHKRGVKHEPITVVIDDAMALRMNAQADYDEMVKFIATVGRSYRVRLIVIMHSDRGVVAGFKGQTDMLDGFLKLQLSIDEASEQRSAVLKRQTSKGETARHLDTNDVYELSRKPLGDIAFPLDVAPAAPRWTDKHALAAGILAAEPDVSGRALARRLYGGDGSGEAFYLAKKIRDEVSEK